jgi:hypothetical protein
MAKYTEDEYGCRSSVLRPPTYQAIHTYCLRTFSYANILDAAYCDHPGHRLVDNNSRLITVTDETKIQLFAVAYWCRAELCTRERGTGQKDNFKSEQWKILLVDCPLLLRVINTSKNETVIHTHN